MALGKKVAIGNGALEMGRKSPESECGPHKRFFFIICHYQECVYTLTNSTGPDEMLLRCLYMFFLFQHIQPAPQERTLSFRLVRPLKGPGNVTSMASLAC